jgi:hypothetical protein
MNDFLESDRRRLLQSGIIALLLWIALLFIVLLLPINKEAKKVQKYTTVAITLTSSIPVKSVSSSMNETSPRLSSNMTTAKKPAVKESSAREEPPKKGSSSSSLKSSAPKGLGIPNFSKPMSSQSESKEPGEYLEFSSQTVPTNTQPASNGKGSTPVSELEGSAASVSPLSTGKSVSGAGSSTLRNGAASLDTTSSLSAISGSLKNAAKDFSGASGQTETTGNEKKASGSMGATSSADSVISGVNFEGGARKILYPSKPSIILPDSLVRLVDSDRTVTVLFTVRADGSVPIGLISFTPSAILPTEVLDYLKKEFSGWRFEKSGEDGQAKFQYSIKVE